MDTLGWQSHGHYQLHLMTVSRGIAIVGDYIGEFMPNSLFLTAPNVPQCWVRSGGETAQTEGHDRTIRFDPQALDLLQRAFPAFDELQPMLQLAQRGIEFKGFDTAEAVMLTNRIRDTQGPVRILAFLDLLTKINAHSNKTALSDATLLQINCKQAQPQAGKAIDYIVENFAKDITVQCAADISELTPSTFSRNFKKLTGQKFVTFVNQVRVQQACIMLQSSDRAIKTICADVGFRNIANFNRHFLKLVEMTPTEYRSSARR